MTKVKNATQLEDHRRRKQLGLSPDGPMIRLFRESSRSRFGHFPTLCSLAILTPLGHYKTKILDLGWDPRGIMCEVAAALTLCANGHAFHNQNDQPIGSKMYEVMKEIIRKRCKRKAGQMRIFHETFML